MSGGPRNTYSELYFSKSWRKAMSYWVSRNSEYIPDLYSIPREVCSLVSSCHVLNEAITSGLFFFITFLNDGYMQLTCKQGRRIIKWTVVNSSHNLLLPHHMLPPPPSLGMNFVLNVAGFTKNHFATCSHMYIHIEWCLVFMFVLFYLYKNNTPCMVCSDLLFVLSFPRCTHVVWNTSPFIFPAL